MKRTTPRPGTQTAQLFMAKRPAVRVKYLLFLPAGCDVRSRRRWPLLLFLHGADERGANLRLVAKHGPPRLAAHRPDFPFIVVSPQCPAQRTWDTVTLLALMDHIVKQLPVDRRRVYLTGISMGGYGAWNLAVTEPQRFAAIAPICGGGDVLPIYLAPPVKERALRTLPVWAFHGGRDDVVPVSESERMIGALRGIGATDARLTVYPDAGHDSWTETYENPRFFEWLLARSR